MLYLSTSHFFWILRISLRTWRVRYVLSVLKKWQYGLGILVSGFLFSRSSLGAGKLLISGNSYRSNFGKIQVSWCFLLLFQYFQSENLWKMDDKKIERNYCTPTAMFYSSPPEISLWSIPVLGPCLNFHSLVCSTGSTSLKRDYPVEDSVGISHFFLLVR